MIGDIKAEHYAQILRMNEHFVHWLSPMDAAKLERVLSIATGKVAQRVGYFNTVRMGNIERLALAHLST